MIRNRTDSLDMHFMNTSENIQDININLNYQTFDLVLHKWV